MSRVTRPAATATSSKLAQAPPGPAVLSSTVHVPRVTKADTARRTHLLSCSVIGVVVASSTPHPVRPRVDASSAPPDFTQALTVSQPGLRPVRVWVVLTE